MRKTHYRDYATEAFRFLAREGSSQAYKNRIWNEALARAAERQAGGGGISAPTEAAITRAEAALQSAAAEVQDLEAAEWAILALRGIRGRDAEKALYAVYMEDPDKELVRGEIHDRVVAASVDIPAGEMTIYRWLGLARDLFAERRGLRRES